MSKELEDISKKLDTVTRLLAFDLIKDKSVNEQIEILTKAGLKVSDIAVILDKTENQIYVTQTTLRKKKKKDTTNQPMASVEGQDV